MEGWKRRFDDPIVLLMAASSLPCSTQRPTRLNYQRKKRTPPEWQAAIESLILVAELGGPTMFARIGVMRALNVGKPDPVITPRRKRTKAYRIV